MEATSTHFKSSCDTESASCLTRIRKLLFSTINGDLDLPYSPQQNLLLTGRWNLCVTSSLHTQVIMDHCCIVDDEQSEILSFVIKLSC
jgi:hypothetical protein